MNLAPVLSGMRMAGTALGKQLGPQLAKGAFTREALIGSGINLALEQGVPRVLGMDPGPLGPSLVRSATIGAVSAPVERVVQSQLGTAYPNLTGPGKALASLAASQVGSLAITEPVTRAVTGAIFPESPTSGQTQQTGTQADVAGAQLQAIQQQMMDPEALEHQRRMDLTYARNYKFPSYIYHISQQGSADPFAIANQMVNVPTTRYF